MNALKLKKNQKGFTLMEMLIVVAIIAVLVAILIPTVSASLEKSKEATDIANLRATYAETQMNYMADPKATEITFKVPKMNYGVVAVADKNSGVDKLSGLFEGVESGKAKDNKITVREASGAVTDASTRTAYYYAKATKVTYKITIGDEGCFEAVTTTNGNGYAIS